MAFPTGWGYKWPIVINADSVISSPVADWPCLITDAHFPEGAWALMQPTGADLRFSLDEAGTTELYYDAPRLSVAGESAHLYVRVPSLLSTGDTTIYGWVGNAAATAPSAAWMQSTYPSEWAAFWPMEEGTGTTVSDRTSNANDGTMTNMDAATDWVQQADGSWALDFDGSNDHVLIPQDATLRPASVSVLTRCYRANTNTGYIVCSRDGTTSNWGLYLGDDTFSTGTGALWFGGDHMSFLEVAGVASTGAWLSVAASASALGGAVLYIGGTQRGTKTITKPGSAAIPVLLGARANSYPTLALRFTGLVHSTVVLSRVVTADEVAIHHLMLSSPAAFATAGDLVAVGGNRYPAAHRTHVWRNGPITYVGGT